MNISIITINLNDREGLKKTILSILKQKTSEIEFIVIDGSSTDGSVELLRNYSPEIDFWVSEEDKGIYHAMNKGIDASSGDYLLFLNSGDWLLENSLKNIFQYLSGEDIVYFNSYHYFSDKYSSSQIPPDQLFPRDLFNKTITHQSVFFKNNLFDIYGKYDESYKICGDYDFLVKIVLNGVVAKHINEFLMYFDRNGISSINSELTAKERKYVIEKYFPVPFIKEYENDKKNEDSLKILLWYKEQKRLYRVLVWGYNIISVTYKNIERFKSHFR